MERLTKSQFMKKYINDYYRKRYKDDEAKKLEVERYSQCKNRSAMWLKQGNKRKG